MLHTAYNDLLQLDFVSTHKETRKQVNFAILVSTRGELRGVPVQIRYQPNWWFQVLLDLQPGSSQFENASLAATTGRDRP